MHVVIVGGGNTGSYLAKMLLESPRSTAERESPQREGQHTVRIIESRQALLEKLAKELPSEVVLSGDG